MNTRGCGGGDSINRPHGVYKKGAWEQKEGRLRVGGGEPWIGSARKGQGATNGVSFGEGGGIPLAVGPSTNHQSGRLLHKT